MMEPNSSMPVWVPKDVVKYAKQLMTHSGKSNEHQCIAHRLLTSPKMQEVWETLFERNRADTNILRYPANLPKAVRPENDADGKLTQGVACALLFGQALLLASSKSSVYTKQRVQFEKDKLLKCSSDLHEMIPTIIRHGICDPSVMKRIIQKLESAASQLTDPEWGVETAARPGNEAASKRRFVEGGLLLWCNDVFGCELPSVVTRLTDACLGTATDKTHSATIARRARRART